jgi:hypothetical protein
MPAYGLSERSPNEVEIARARRCSEGVDVINWYPAGRGGATEFARGLHHAKTTKTLPC